MHVQEMYRRLTGLVVFRRLLQDPVVAACGEMLSARGRGQRRFLRRLRRI